MVADPRTASRPPAGGAVTVRRRRGLALRPLARPRPARVHTDASNRPTALREGGRREGEQLRRVLQVRESWRIDDEWWRRPISRVYWEVVLEPGRVVTLYRDLVDGRWYLQ